jgi:hypothetical protein
MPGRFFNKANQNKAQLEPPMDADQLVSSYHCCILTNAYQSLDFVSVYKLYSTVHFRFSCGHGF